MNKEELIEAVKWLEEDVAYLEKMIKRHSGLNKLWLVNKLLDAQSFSKCMAKIYSNQLKHLEDDNYRES